MPQWVGLSVFGNSGRNAYNNHFYFYYFCVAVTSNDIISVVIICIIFFSRAGEKDERKRSGDTNPKTQRGPALIGSLRGS